MESFDFIKEGSVVFWNDPDNGNSSGIYVVTAAPEDIDSDSVILLESAHSEAEVTPIELQPLFEGTPVMGRDFVEKDVISCREVVIGDIITDLDGQDIWFVKEIKGGFLVCVPVHLTTNDFEVEEDGTYLFGICDVEWQRLAPLPYKIHVLFGSDACNAHISGTLPDYLKMDECYDYMVRNFESEAEANAYRLALQDHSDWCGSSVLVVDDEDDLEAIH